MFEDYINQIIDQEIHNFKLMNLGYVLNDCLFPLEYALCFSLKYADEFLSEDQVENAVSNLNDIISKFNNQDL